MKITVSFAIPVVFLLATAFVSLLHDMAAAAETSPGPELQQVQSLVGQWRGVGQLRRGSTSGAWQVQGQWAWTFQGEQPALQYHAKDSKYLKSASLRHADGQYLLTANAPAGQSQEFRGKRESTGRLRLVANQPLPSGIARISFRLVAGGDRLLMLLEKPIGGSGRFSRLAEVGFTRQGSEFGKGRAYVECVVTGGKGTIPVTFEGNTYYVCCGGCRDYFNENPAEVLAEYRDRKQAEKSSREDGSKGKPEKNR